MMTDPVCGMDVDPARAAARHEHQGTTYCFCCDGCRDLFRADPAKYAAGSPPGIHPARSTHRAPARYTCPMHPQITSNGPGTCPICGMALEPMVPTLDDET